MVPCEAMMGIFHEADQTMEEAETDLTRDAGIICTAQKVEHYEIATYGSLCAFANVLGEGEITALLKTTLDEENLPIRS